MQVGNWSYIVQKTVRALNKTERIPHQLELAKVIVFLLSFNSCLLILVILTKVYERQNKHSVQVNTSDTQAKT